MASRSPSRSARSSPRGRGDRRGLPAAAADGDAGPRGRRRGASPRPLSRNGVVRGVKTMSLGPTFEIRGLAHMEVSDSGGDHLGTLGAIGP